MINKESLIKAIAVDTGYPVEIVSTVVEAMLQNITRNISRGERVKFSGFGTFAPKSRAARVGRNPHTGEKVPIPPRVVPVFTPGSELKEAVVKQAPMVLPVRKKNKA